MSQAMKKMLSFVLTWGLFPILVACSSNPQGLLDAGAAQFSAGKSQESYALKTSGQVLDELIEQYSGSFQVPASTQMSDDDFEDAQQKRSSPADTDGGSDASSGSGQSVSRTEVSNESELLRAFHNAYDNTAEYLEFQVVDGFTVDLSSELQDIYTQILRDDPIDASGVSSWSYGSNGDVYLVQIIYSFEIDELIEMKDTTRTLVKEAAASLDTDGLSDYQIVCAVNDYLCDTVYYPEEEPYAPVTHTAYGALAEGCAVCEGYACAAKLLLNQLGIPCDIEVGTCLDGGGHAWNLVQLEGEWYQLDVTWNDGSTSRTDYLLITDEEMKESRTWEEADYPATPDTAYQP